MNDKIFTQILSIVFSLFFWGCSNYKDLQSIPPETLPESVIKVMSDAYPDATDATFRAVEKDELYEVNYKLNGNPFYAALDTRKILSVYRMYGAVPDSMKRALPARSVQGGNADLFREPVPQPNVYPTFIAKYTWNNVDYLLSWYQYDTDNPIRYFLRMEPYAKFSYTIHAEEQSDLPRPVTGFLEREKLNLSTAQISVNERNEKQYFVNAATASGTNYQFTFDNAGKLINTVYQAEAFYYNVEEYPEQIRTFIKNAPAFSAMKLIQGYKFSNVLGTGYVMNMQATNENCWLNFDQDGKFVNMTYQTAIYR